MSDYLDQLKAIDDAYPDPHECAEAQMRFIWRRYAEAMARLEEGQGPTPATVGA